MTKPLHERVDALTDIPDPDAAFDAAFSLVAFTLNRYLIDHLLRTTRLLTDGDFEALVIWGVVAHLNIAHLMPPGSLPAAVLNERGRVPGEGSGFRPLKLRDVAAITGIPRETARRKLAKLEAQGYVEKTPDGWVVGMTKAEPDLREFTRESIWRFLITAEQILEQLKHAPRARPPVS